MSLPSTIPLTFVGDEHGRVAALQARDNVESDGDIHLHWFDDSGVHVARSGYHVHGGADSSGQAGHFVWYTLEGTLDDPSLAKRMNIGAGSADEQIEFPNVSQLRLQPRDAHGRLQIEVSDRDRHQNLIQMQEGTTPLWDIYRSRSDNSVRVRNRTLPANPELVKWSRRRVSYPDARVINHGRAASSGVVWESGAPSDRPRSPAVGQRYFDEKHGRPVWYDGEHWVDAMGEPV